MNFWDLGGQDDLRSLWEKYYEESHGIIFVVDSCDEARIDNVRKTLESVLLNDKIHGLPVSFSIIYKMLRLNYMNRYSCWRINKMYQMHYQ